MRERKTPGRDGAAVAAPAGAGRCLGGGGQAQDGLRGGGRELQQLEVVARRAVDGLKARVADGLRDGDDLAAGGRQVMAAEHDVGRARAVGGGEHPAGRDEGAAGKNEACPCSHLQVTSRPPPAVEQRSGQPHAVLILREAIVCCS